MVFPSYWECHHPNGRSPSFFRGVETQNHQPDEDRPAKNGRSVIVSSQFDGQFHGEDDQQRDVFRVPILSNVEIYLDFFLALSQPCS